MTTETYKGDVCSANHAFALDNFFRRLIQNPEKITGAYINKGDTIIDIGCGPGFFSTAMARMTGSGGRVIAVDLQNKMLEKVERKAQKLGLTGQMSFHKCAQDQLGFQEDVKADFILAYYMVHETPDHDLFFMQVKKHLKSSGNFLIVEPPFHVGRKKFQEITDSAIRAGFKVADKPGKKGGKSLLLTL